MGSLPAPEPREWAPCWPHNRMLKPDTDLSAPDRDRQNQSKIWPKTLPRNLPIKNANGWTSSVLPEVPNPPSSQHSEKKGVYLWQILLELNQCTVNKRPKKRIYKGFPFWPTQHHYCTKNSFINYPNCASVHALGHTCFSDSAQAQRQVTRLANRKTVLQNSNCQLKALLTLQKEARLLGKFGQPRIMISGTGKPLWKGQSMLLLGDDTLALGNRSLL